MHIVILGGSTAGASVAAQLRRQSESCRITLLEKSGYLATAYCGLAYAAGEIVRPDPDYLRPLDPQNLSDRFNIEVRLYHEVTQIDSREKTVTARDANGDRHCIAYDKLVYATGARSRIPDIPGTSHPSVHTLRTTENLETLLASLTRPGMRHVLIAGAGFVGLELAESLAHRGLEVTVLEQSSQVMAGKLDPDMSRLLMAALQRQKFALHLNESVCEILPQPDGAGIVARTAHRSLNADLLILAAGIQPNSELAAQAGLALSVAKTVRVNDQLQTSDPHIYALGDVAEIACRVSGHPVHVPLAGPLGRQAKVLATGVMGGNMRYPGSLGSFICKVFDQTVASTGMTETRLKQHGIPYRRILMPATNHVYFYPGVASMLLKLLYAEDGRILGAQIVGGEGSDKRIDILATAITAGMTVADPEYLELAYAPPYGAPKDVVNQIGALASAQLNDGCTLVHPDDLNTPAFKDAVLVDIRSTEEFELGSLPDAIHIPAEALRKLNTLLPRHHPIILFCNSGAKGTSAQSLLAAAGYRSFNLMGGLALMNNLKLIESVEPTPTVSAHLTAPTPIAPTPTCDYELDLRGLVCPGPLVVGRKYLASAPRGQVVRILTTDSGFRQDFQGIISRLGLHVLSEGRLPDAQWITVRIAVPQPAVAV